MRDSVGARVAGQLYAAEDAIDLAVRELALLAALLPAARIEAHVSAVTGQAVVESTAAGLRSLAEARGHVVQAHHGLAAVARSMGLETLAVGPVDKPEDRATRPRPSRARLTRTDT